MELWDYCNSLDFVFCFILLNIRLPELKVCIYFSLKRLVFNSGGKFCFPNKLFSSILTEQNDLIIVPLCLSYTLKNKNLAPRRRWTVRLFSGDPFLFLYNSPLTLLFYFLVLFCFLHHLVQTLENCMSRRMILNNAIIFICKYAKM